MLKVMSKSNVLSVTFEKKDGSERVMKCTLMADKLPPVEVTEGKATKAENPDVLAVWDLEASGWRSFRLDSVKLVEVSS
jgi:hypothetical protein